MSNMCNYINAPTLYMYIATSQELCIHLNYKNGASIPASGVEAIFGISPYSALGSAPLIMKTGVLDIDNETNVVRSILIHLSPDDSKHLIAGKYRYQVIVKDIGGGAEIPIDGFIIARHNIHNF